jgi:hypothetical protein
MSRKMSPGRGWAYLGLVVGLAASVTGNVANTLLVTTQVHDGLRVPFAVLWPLLTYLAIEVLTRTQWRSGWAHVLTRAFLAGPVALVAAFVSYLHLHHLMILAGEPGLAQAVGPLAIDGTLFGCTVALLITSPARDIATERRSLAERVAAARTAVTDIRDAVRVPVARGSDIGATTVPCLSDAPMGPEVPPVKIPAQRVPALRGSWDVAKAVQMILNGSKDAVIADVVGISPKVIQRTRRAVTLLRSNPRAEVPAAWKVPPAVVEVIRREVPAW